MTEFFLEFWNFQSKCSLEKLRRSATIIQGADFFYNLDLGTTRFDSIMSVILNRCSIKHILAL